MGTTIDAGVKKELMDVVLKSTLEALDGLASVFDQFGTTPLTAEQVAKHIRSFAEKYREKLNG